MLVKAVFALSLLLTTFGCGGRQGDSEDESFGSSEAALASRKLHHYSPSVQGARWDAGCGVPGPASVGCSSGVVVTFTKQYIDLKQKVTTSLNHSTKTLTIKIDTSSTNTIHSLIAVRPQDDNLGTLNLQLGKNYHVKVEDYWRHVLWTGDVQPELAL
jgi:hypothetical protein